MVMYTNVLSMAVAHMYCLASFTPPAHITCCVPHYCAFQAQRLSWHASIALWCGNNEIDLSYEWSNSTVLRSNRNMFVVDYQAVFIDTVRKNIKQVRSLI